MSDIVQLIADTATRYGVAPELAIEVATAESGLNPNTPDSSAGAIGIFQLEPATAASLGVDPRDPVQNIDGGVRYLRQLLNQFSELAAAVGAYDWGPGRVSSAIAKYGANWLAHAPSETQNYVSKILSNLGTQYTVSVDPAAVPSSVSPVPPSTPDPASSFTASVQAPSDNFGTYLLWGALGLFALWIFEEAM
jgi:soluble lytic murein transglycosylase-like protein